MHVYSRYVIYVANYYKPHTRNCRWLKEPFNITEYEESGRRIFELVVGKPHEKLKPTSTYHLSFCLSPLHTRERVGGWEPRLSNREDEKLWSFSSSLFRKRLLKCLPQVSTARPPAWTFFIEGIFLPSKQKKSILGQAQYNVWLFVLFCGKLNWYAE